jgi:hypothetical protein
MAISQAFDRLAGFAELNVPDLGSPLGVRTPAQRKSVARANLGVFAALDGITNLRLGIQPSTVQATPAAVNATVTMTAANLLTGLITSTTAAAVVATLPLATAMETAYQAQYGNALAVGDSFEVNVINTGGANAFTMTTNTGWTLVGNMVVAFGTSAHFRVQRNTATTYTLYRVS